MPIDYRKRSSGSAAPSGAAAPAGKVSLTKAGQTVSLVKQTAGGRMVVNLNWSQSPVRGGGLFRSRQAIDLDLGCLYELNDGQRGVVQALGNSFGSFDSTPYVMLDKDDRSGASSEGENLFVNLARQNEIKRLLVFAFIYEGAPAFDAADGAVTLMPHNDTPIEVRLDEQAGDRKMCAIALIQNVGNELVVRREVQYFRSHSDMDRAYDWGLRWAAGRK
jgi:tellurite resistance protein TerA